YCNRVQDETDPVRIAEPSTAWQLIAAVVRPGEPALLQSTSTWCRSALVARSPATCTPPDFYLILDMTSDNSGRRLGPSCGRLHRRCARRASGAMVVAL